MTLFSIMMCFYFLMLVTVLNLETFNNFKAKVFKVSGVVELIPGPCEIIRSVQGSFGKGNVVLFSKTYGRQCDYNALFSFFER